MFYKCIKFEIERERIKTNVWFWQPLLILLTFLFVFVSHQYRIYGLYSLIFITFPMLLIFYIYINLIKPTNLILIEINRNRLSINEPDNPFTKSINISIEECESILKMYHRRGFGIKKIPFLSAQQNDKDIKLIRIRSFWYGEVTNENLQELLFHLQQQKPNLIIDESLNEL